MATSPIRMRDEDKARLEALQRDLSRATGKKPTQQDVLARLVEFAASNKDAFLSQVAWKPLTRAQISRWLAAAENLGDWSTADIDDIVYGDPQ